MSTRKHVVGLCLFTVMVGGAVYFGASVSTAVADGRGTLFLFGGRARTGEGGGVPIGDDTPPVVTVSHPFTGSTWRLVP